LFLSSSLCAASSGVSAKEDDAPRRVDPLAADAVQLEQAQRRFERGKRLFDAERYAEALVEFDASAAIVASPNADLYRARCLRALGRTVDAYVAFGRTAVRARELSKLDPRYARAAESAHAERDELAPELGFVKIQVKNPDDQTRLFVNGLELARSAWGEPAVALAGSVELVLTTPGRSRHVKRLRVTPGATRDVVLDAGFVSR
jgi:hypothetical protein